MASTPVGMRKLLNSLRANVGEEPHGSALIGFYNVANAGDERLRAAWDYILDRPISAVINLNAVKPSRIQDFRWVLIGGGAILHRHASVFNTEPSNLFNKKQKIGVAGVSASGQFAQEQLPAVQQLIERSEFFFVRDRRTLQLLDNEKVELPPDLSWCFPLETSDIPVDADIALSLAPCPWKQAFSVEKWVSAMAGLKILPWPFFYQGGRDVDLIEGFFSNIPNEFSQLTAMRSKVVVCSRYHAIQFALQLGKPFVAINYDHKVSDFCADYSLDGFCFEVDEANEAREKIDEILADYSCFSEEINGAREKLLNEGRALKNEIRRHIDQRIDRI